MSVIDGLLSFLKIGEKSAPKDENTNAIVPVDDIKKKIFDIIFNQPLNKSLFADVLALQSTCKHWRALVAQSPLARSIKEIFQLKACRNVCLNLFKKSHPGVSMEWWDIYRNDPNLIKANEYEEKINKLKKQQ